MLANGRALLDLCNDSSYKARISGTLAFLQEDHWRMAFGVLKANILFIFNKQDDFGVLPPIVLLIVEDCIIDLCDDNLTGRSYSFQIKFKTTGRVFTFAADSFRALEKWVSMLTVSSIDYISLTKQSFLEQLPMKTARSKRSVDSTASSESVKASEEIRMTLQSLSLYRILF
ncbi:hypothetical protein AB6A40_001952 [Gnathostoma spinigerum]|uniref:PH domain-containing protein n=1 Tax=Gnathostoma spinigerum TaxID=75299 RepID=A0ABD6E5I7_9BILA